MNRFSSAQFFLTLILICLAGLTALVIATGYVLTRQKAATDRLNEAIDLHDRSCRLADQLRQSSDDLTRMVRTYAVTGDSTFEEHFYTILNIRDGKVPRPEHYDRIFWDFKVAGEVMPGSQDGKRVSLRTLMEDAGFADKEFELLAEAKRRSDRLVELEEVAMNAIKGKFRDEEGTFTTIKPPDRELALQILFGKEYHQAKSEIMKPINDFLIASDARTAGALAEAQEERRSLSLALVCLLCCLLFVSPLVAFAGYRYHRVSHAELNHSEERFRATFEQAAVGIAHVSADGEFLRINDRFCEIVGYTRDEMLASTFQNITHPDDLAADVEHVQRLLRGEADTYSMKKRYYRKDGNTVWVNLTVSLIREDTGKPRWFVSVAEDITEQKQAEEALKESQGRFRRLVEQSPVSIQVHGLDGKLVQSNAAYASLYALDDETLTEAYEKYNVRKDEQAEQLGLMSYVERTYAGEDVVFPPYEYDGAETLRTLDFRDTVSRKRWVQTRGFPLKDDAGSVASVVFLSEDITEIKRVEDEMRKSEAHLLRAQEVANSGSWDLDILSGKLFWSAEVYRIFGVPQGEPLSYKAFLETVLPEDRELVEQSWQAAMRGEPYDIEHRILVDGQTKWLREKAQIDFDGNGQAIRGVGIVQDITGRKKAEAQIHAYQERLRALALELTMTEERERRRIATELHDGAAQSLAFARVQLASACKAVAEAEAAKKLDDVSQILRESLGQIREMLLDLSSPSMNEIGLGVAISEWLEQQIGRRHGLKTSFADECGKVPLDDDVRAVLFRNTRELLTNVVKHAQAHTVAVRMESTGEALRITIEDDGAGLDPDNAAGTSGGGFGLFSIRERMLDLGGSLEIVSARGKGCEATLVMPLDKGE